MPSLSWTKRSPVVCPHRTTYRGEYRLRLLGLSRQTSAFLDSVPQHGAQGDIKTSDPRNRMPRVKRPMAQIKQSKFR
jgi:hypothetical protein